MSSLSSKNKGIKYLLTIIDVFSKYGWMIPLNNKSGTAVAKALKLIFQERKPNKLWVDKGKEFYNKGVQDLIPIYSTENEEKSSVVERWNRTMKERMFKYFTTNNTRTYIDILDDMVKKYNNTIHSTIDMTPTEASKLKNENRVRINLYPNLPPPSKSNISVGDKVRITKKKGVFKKGYTPRWTEEIFIVSKKLYTNPVTFKIKDLNGEEIVGSFYEPELQKSTQNLFRIEKILQRKGKKSLVKWVGYPQSFNSWIDTKKLIKL